MSILNLVQANQQWGYELHYGESFAGNVGIATSVNAPEPNLSKYDYGSDVFLVIEACTNTVIPSTTSLDANKGFNFFALNYDASPNWDTSTTNLMELAPDAGSSELLKRQANVGIQFFIGNPTRPKFSSTSTRLAIGNSDPLFGLSFRGSIHYLTLRKKFAGQIGYVSNSSYLPLMQDTIITSNGDPKTVALWGGTANTGSVALTTDFPDLGGTSDTVLPLSTSTKGYLVIAAAATTNPSIQTIDWPFTGGEYYGPIFINDHYVLIKIANVQVNDVYKKFAENLSVNGGNPIFGQVAAMIIEVRA